MRVARTKISRESYALMKLDAVADYQNGLREGSPSEAILRDLRREYPAGIVAHVERQTHRLDAQNV